MKHFKTLLLIAVFTIGMGGVAQAQKTGHIALDKLIANMPATKTMQAELEKMQKTYKDDITALAKKLDDKMKKYQAEAKAQTKATNEARAAEVNQERNRVLQAEQLATQEMQKKYNEKLNPIILRAKKAIEEVAAAKGIAYVFDATPGKGLLVFDKGIDLYDAVKAKLGF